MRFSRISKALGVAAVSALALSACASTDNGSGDGDSGSTKSISVAELNTFSSLNTGSSSGNTDINNKIATATHNGFYSITDQLEVKHNDDFGSFEKVSDDPLKVKYTVNEDEQWSDGNKIDKADLLLAWASQSGHFNGEGENGEQFFDYAGDSEGLGLTDMPEFSDDGRTMTLTYSKPYIDWETAFDVGLPAHVVAKKAGMSEEDLVNTLTSAKPGEKNEQLSKIADAWNTGFDTTKMPDDKDLLVASGPYKIKDIVENQSVTLEKNDKYTGDEPKIDEITMRSIGDANGQLQALNNGEVQVISPQANVDTIQQLKDADGVKTLTGDQLLYDHVDLNFNSDVFKDENTRKAFLLTIPRQSIVDKLMKPMNSDAEVLNSQVYVNSQDEYKDAVEKNDSSEFPSSDMDANISQAKELLGGKTPTVRLLYNSGNKARADVFQMIQESAKKAGFNVEDLGAADWSKKLPGGDYDASLFGWTSSGVGHSSFGQIFAAGGGGNYNGYDNEDVNKKADEIRTTVGDDDKVKDLAIGIDKDLFDDSYGLPLFQQAGVVGMKDNVENVTFNPGSSQVWWNVEKWDIKN